MANNTRLTLIIVGGFLFCADRIFKSLSASSFSKENIFGGFFGWFPSVNSGIAFGLKLPQILIIFLSILFIIFLLEYFRRNENMLLRFGIFFILLGAISNLFDRLIYGKTFDYLILYISLFNIADILIVTGAVMCAIYAYSRKTIK